MNNKTYDVLKWIAQYLLPASGTLYFALSSIWGLPHGEQVVGTIAALTAFLGVILGVSSAKYDQADNTDGVLEVESNDQRDLYNLKLTTGLSEINNKDSITLKVDNRAYIDISHDKHTL